MFEYNNGVRDHYEYKNAVLSNSLFTDFLLSNGLKVWKDESTRDIICLEFNYGSRSYEDEIAHLQKVGRAARLEYQLAKSQGYDKNIERKRNKRQKIARLYMAAAEIQDRYEKKTKEEIRCFFYNNGATVEYVTHNRAGEVIKRETIHYQMLFRSTGKAKKGTCMFICDRLYKKATNFLHMGIKLPKTNAPIVETSAYIPLSASAIVGKIEIKPQNILVLKDVDRYFTTNVVSVETNPQKQCIARYIEGYSLKNTLFDGQALIDSSIFPDWGDGYILLRHHFCKMAAFCSHIQKFFKDYFGDNYETATVKDMFGNEHYVKDIRLITTDNAMKWLKFGVSYEYWCHKIGENGSMFGIVKTSHGSKLGNLQRMSYQMVNSLDEKTMDGVLNVSSDYITRLKKNNTFFLDYLQKNTNFYNDFDVLVALCRQNSDFLRSTYFRQRKGKIIENYTLNLRSGKILENGENLTVVGSPYAMLLYAATGDESAVDRDDTFYPEADTIQCYTERFNSGEYLAGFRSPFNGRNNLLYLHNTYSSNMKKYFELGQRIIAINMIGTDAQDRANGMDMDADFLFATNQPNIVAHARLCYKEYPTIVNNIPKEKNLYNLTADDYAKIDNALAKSQLDIGESSNLAQIAQTYSYNFDDPKFGDYVCILSVLAQVAIDNAKRRFDVDIGKEIRRIKKDMDIKHNGYPAFWTLIRRGVDKTKINKELTCPMNYLYEYKFPEFHEASPTLPMRHFFKSTMREESKRKCRKVEELIEKYSLELYETISSEDDNPTNFLLLRKDFDDMIADIRKIKISKNYLGLFSWLINRAFLITPQISINNDTLKGTMKKNKALLLKVLYEINPKNLLECFSRNSNHSQMAKK